MKRNRELLRKVAKRLREKWKGYAQGTYGAPYDDAPCGTITCLAGEIIICSEETEKQGLKVLWDILQTKTPSYVAIEAARRAGINPEKPNGSIFAGSAQAWPAKFKDMWYEAEGQKEQAYAAAAYMDHLANGGKL